MKNYVKQISWFLLVVAFTDCTPHRKRGETTEQIHERTGEAIAVDNLIQQYEEEHQHFYKQETKEANYLGWPNLEKKDLSNYCRKFLQFVLPKRNSEGAIGLKNIRTLHYENKSGGITSNVIVIQCKVKSKSHKQIYYMTGAPKPNCVYALKSKGSWRGFILTIINKYCDFEEKPLINNSLKRKKLEIVNKIHSKTGQPIAKDEYLLEYELEHEELLRKHGKNGKRIEWPHAIHHHNIDLFCYHYIKACVPRRNSEKITGSWKTEKLHYEKMNTHKDVDVATVTCVLPNVSKRSYHITRALENNCVYALLRGGSNVHKPLIIIFKHCDFEYPNNQKISHQHQDTHKESTIQKVEVKEEMYDTLETMHLFPVN